uniref:Uncharacterized protein n=1 Tax=Romanomermis culicivorax TaxID=13658 RepID=A0A915K8T3_ROMCU
MFGDHMLKRCNVFTPDYRSSATVLPANGIIKLKAIVCRAVAQSHNINNNSDFEQLWLAAVQLLQKRCYNLWHNAVKTVMMHQLVQMAVDGE